MFGLVTRRRLQDETAALRAQLAQVCQERDTARSERNAFRAAAKEAAGQFAAADAANQRLSGRNLELSRRLAADSGPSRADQLQQRVDRLRRIVSRLLAERRAEKRRADHLQRRLDDAMGLNTSAVLDGARKRVAS
jgi:chromosome segregation ATPase